MLPRPPDIVKCSGCAECYWLADARSVGVIPSWGDASEAVDPAWTAAPEVQEPTEDEYYKAIHGGLAVGSQQERILRTLAWWRRNDAFRDFQADSGATTDKGSEECRRNMETLAVLLSQENENNWLMKAEVLRELGQFESSKAILDGVSSSEYRTVVAQIRDLCDAGDTVVRELLFGG
jgi:hypothetical protein